MLRVFLVIDDYNELMYLQTLLKKFGVDVDGLQNPKKYADLSLGFNPQILIATARGKVVDGISLAQGIRRRNGMPRVIVLKNSDQLISNEEIEAAGIDMVLDSPINPKKLILALANIGSLDENLLFEKFAKIQGSPITNANDTIYVQHYDENGQPVEDIKKVKLELDQLLGTGEKKSKDAKQFPIKNESEAEKLEAANAEKAAFPKESEASPQLEPPGEVKKERARVTPESDPERQKRFERWQKEIGPLPNKSFDRDRILAFNKKIRSAEMPDDIDEIEGERKLFVKTLFTKGSKS